MTAELWRWPLVLLFWLVGLAGTWAFVAAKPAPSATPRPVFSDDTGHFQLQAQLTFAVADDPFRLALDDEAAAAVDITWAGHGSVLRRETLAAGEAVLVDLPTLTRTTHEFVLHTVMPSAELGPGAARLALLRNGELLREVVVWASPSEDVQAQLRVDLAAEEASRGR